MSVYFLSVDFDADKGAVIERRIRTAIPDLVKIGSFEEISLNALPEANHQNYLLLLAPTRNSADFAKIIEILSRHRDHLFSILISEDISATDYKKIIRTGHVDWVSAAADPQEIFDIISKQTSGIRTARATPCLASYPVICSERRRCWEHHPNGGNVDASQDAKGHGSAPYLPGRSGFSKQPRV